VISYDYDNRERLRQQEKRTVVDPVAGPRKQYLDENDLQGLRGKKPEELPTAPRPAGRLNYFDPYRGLFSLPR
jgi:hypothetical protein